MRHFSTRPARATQRCDAKWNRCSPTNPAPSPSWNSRRGGRPRGVCAARLTALGRATLGHYRVESLLGAGGMGEVYLARDPRLERAVALKILPLDLTVDADRLQRFMREAKAASALNHPNVATIHDIGESDERALHRHGVRRRPNARRADRGRR